MLARAHKALLMAQSNPSPMMLMASQRTFATVAPHSRMPREKDYYKILDLESDATPE